MYKLLLCLKIAYNKIYILTIQRLYVQNEYFHSIKSNIYARIINSSITRINLNQLLEEFFQLYAFIY